MTIVLAGVLEYLAVKISLMSDFYKVVLGGRSQELTANVVPGLVRGVHGITDNIATKSEAWAEDVATQHTEDQKLNPEAEKP